MKKGIRIAALMVTLFAVLNITAFANSGPGYSTGRASTGVITVFDDCPVQVEKEVLTFDISEFPWGYDLSGKIKNYNATVTAEYTFFNPTDYDITATLYFPFGEFPEYIDHYINDDKFEIYPDIEKYSITVDGVETDKDIRFTYSMGDFSMEDSLKYLNGETDDEFFYPDMLVTKYVYHIENYDFENNDNIEVALEWVNEDDETAVMFMNSNSYSTKNENSATLSKRLYSDEEIIIYTLGKEKENLDLRIYKTSEEAQKAEIVLEEKRSLTFRELILDEIENESERDKMISDEDWYNICLAHVNHFLSDRHKTINSDYMFNYYYNNVMGWYEYEITIPAGGKIVNRVTAPVYPLINYEFSPYMYEYEYLLSPAQQWADFGDIEININTPYHMLEINQENFMKTDTGYTYTGKGLPDGELEFVLCESESPKVNNEYSAYYMYKMVILAVFRGSVIAMIYSFKKYD